MGKGRKNRTPPPRKNFQASGKAKSGLDYRNLLPAELGAVIFGCKHHTFNECLQKQIFGLPYGHYSYVKNINPGLTLFLFNYSDRKLHGIFEAASPGQQGIDQFAWTESEGAELTPYVAQVRINVMCRCRPLEEEEFKPILAKNYYTERLFWFELDKTQTRKLINLFSSFPMLEEKPRPPNLVKGKKKFDILSGHGADEAGENEFVYPDPQECSGVGETKLTETERSSPLAVTNSGDFAQGQKWSELFKGSSSVINPGKGLESQKIRLSTSKTDKVGIEWEFSSSSHQTINMLPEACPDVVNNESDSPVVESWEDLELHEIKVSGGASVSNTEYERSGNAEVLTEDIKSSTFGPVFAKLMEEIEGLKATQLQQKQKIEYLEQELLKYRNHELGTIRSYASEHLDIGDDCKPPNFEMRETLLIIGGFDGYSFLPDLSSYSPSEDHVSPLCPMKSARSYASVAKLSGEVYVLGGVHGNVCCETVESYNPVSDQWFERPSLNKRKGSLAGASLCGKIFAIGGGDGVECFSDVEAWDMIIGRWNSTQPMLEKRYAPSAIEFNGAIYVTGGYDGNYYLRSAERFDPRERGWTRLSSMNSSRGCHSLVAFKEKIYAIGGFSGVEMLSTVEVLDPRIGSWTMDLPMQTCRGYFGSFVFGGKIYAIGGIEDEGILDTVELYEEGSGWRATGLNGIGKRAFFSTFVL